MVRFAPHHVISLRCALGTSLGAFRTVARWQWQSLPVLRRPR
jgi:hypothetical protein